MTKIRQLNTHANFERMRVFSRPIVIFQDGELLESAAIIKNHDDNVVISTTNEHYIKNLLVNLLRHKKLTKLSRGLTAHYRKPLPMICRTDEKFRLSGCK
ncbi:hypothetical protein Back11_34160 [Paenibacillus baekrokdamisoli]|uniref:Uncharacterized protein n=1 Tax=Paenibacillus baekrokdamisoli TaxID=1712516 RepID=A0A3G9J8E5_9BACL|nr:hypothetical protein [Paenibacillus baekrokdamisoli]BBH22071.1 hypothetical protein Back11_34160 [Paenibacillus baekrokdamisoli]